MTEWERAFSCRSETLSNMHDDEWYLSNIKQRPSRLNAKKIGSVVRQLMARSGYGQVQANEELQAQWELAAGEVLARNSRPGNIARGVLLVHVTDSSSLQELQLCKRQILEALQRNYPQANIKNLRGRISQF
jgi:predicted nucleic acid-binding Zn ribbon protein